jgi:hypothetical protein
MTTAQPGRITEEQEERIDRLIRLAIENLAVRKGLLEDPAATIDRFRGVLGFGSQDLSLEALDLIASITPEEFEMAKCLSEKARKYDLRRIKFPL